MNVLITGGAGFIGTPLTQALVKRGWQVTVLTRTGKSPDPKATAIKGDVTDKASLREAMAGRDMVIHNAGWYEFGIANSAKAKMQAINVQGTQNVLELAQELKIPRVVYTSSTIAIGDTGGKVWDESAKRQAPYATYYEQTKTEAHDIAVKFQEQGLPLIIACPAQVIGPGDHAAFGWYGRLYVRGLLPPVIWGPNTTYSFVYMDDVAEGIALAAEKGQPGQTYFLGEGIVSMRDLMPIWKEAVGGIPPFIWLPRPLAVAQGALVEPLLRLFGIPAFISREVVASSYVSFQYTSEKAKRELGWQPRSGKQAWIDTLRAERAAKG